MCGGGKKCGLSRIDSSRTRKAPNSFDLKELLVRSESFDRFGDRLLVVRMRVGIQEAAKRLLAVLAPQQCA